MATIRSTLCFLLFTTFTHYSTASPGFFFYPPLKRDANFGVGDVGFLKALDDLNRIKNQPEQYQKDFGFPYIVTSKYEQPEIYPEYFYDYPGENVGEEYYDVYYPEYEKEFDEEYDPYMEEVSDEEVFDMLRDLSADELEEFSDWMTMAGNEEALSRLLGILENELLSQLEAEIEEENEISDLIGDIQSVEGSLKAEGKGGRPMTLSEYEGVNGNGVGMAGSIEDTSLVPFMELMGVDPRDYNDLKQMYLKKRVPYDEIYY